MSLNPKMTDWAGRVVWVVGASSGIGRAVATLLYARGAQVVVSARNVQVLEGFTAAHPGSLALPLDVRDAEALQAAAQRIHRQYGRVDLSVFCAAMYKAHRATEFDLSLMLQHERVNYAGALHWLDALLPILLQQGHGHLSVVASVAGYRGLPQALAYGPTKAALINLSETLYLDLHPRGLGVSVINPGFVETPLTAQNEFTMPSLLKPEQAAAAILKGWAQGRFEIHFPRNFTLGLKVLGLLPDALYFRLIRHSTGL
jgi:NAD(P)-dependent dehydrogenase (short-subunit alcohol dehydrogenase family)